MSSAESSRMQLSDISPPAPVPGPSSVAVQSACALAERAQRMAVQKRREERARRREQELDAQAKAAQALQFVKQSSSSYSGGAYFRGDLDRAKKLLSSNR